MKSINLGHRSIFLLFLFIPSIYLFLLETSVGFSEFVYFVLRRDRLVNLLWIGPLLCAAALSALYIADEMRERFAKLHVAVAGAISLVLHLSTAIIIYSALEPKYSNDSKDLYQVFTFIFSLSLPCLILIFFELVLNRGGGDA